MSSDAADLPGPSDMRRGEPSKLLGLEVIRFLSAMAVLVWHYQLFYYIADKPGPNYVITSQPLYGLLAPFYQAGYYGVNVFWCISGFIFFWKYRHAIANRKIGAKKFFWLRFSRLYPLHLATLILVAGLQHFYFDLHSNYFVYLYNDLYHFVLNLFFASSWGLQEGYSFNGPIWSISVEILIYLLFFLSLRYLGISIWVTIIAIIIGCAGKAAQPLSPIFDCLAFFYLGGLSCIVRDQITRLPIARVANLWISVLALAMPVAAALTGAFSVRHFGYLFWLSYSPLLVYVGAGDLRVGARLQAVVEAAGNMTYSSYLIHFPLQIAIAIGFAYAQTPIPVTSAGFLLTFLLTSLLLAFAIFEWFEKPAQRLIRRQTGRRALYG